MKTFLATLWRTNGGARRHRESSWLAPVVVQAGDDGGLDEGSDIGDRERWIHLKYILEIKWMDLVPGWTGKGREERHAHRMACGVLDCTATYTVGAIGSHLTALETEAQRQDLPNVTQHVSGRAWIHTRVYTSLKPMPFPATVFSLPLPPP